MRRLLAFLSLVLAFIANAETITGQVVGVADGDTVTVLDADKVRHKIRLAGIDVPEKSQPFGNRAKESLSGMVVSQVPNEQTPETRGQYEFSEQEAKAKRVGLWRDAEPVPP